MLYIMRHGKTEWNALHKLQGRTDIPLNEDGRAMAKAAHDEYMDVNIDVCYCSPLVRARETAEIVLAGRNVPIIPDDRLKEMCFGQFEGMQDIFKTPKCPINVVFKHPEDYTESLGGAESFDDLFKRTGEFLNEVALPLVNDGKDVLIVGHGAMNLSIISQIRKLPRKDFWSPGLKQCKLECLIYTDV